MVGLDEESQVKILDIAELQTVRTEPSDGEAERAMAEAPATMAGILEHLSYNHPMLMMKVLLKAEKIRDANEQRMDRVAEMYEAKQENANSEVVKQRYGWWAAEYSRKSEKELEIYEDIRNWERDVRGDLIETLWCA